MTYVLRCYSYRDEKYIDVMYSEKFNKLDKFIDLVVAYFSYPEYYRYTFCEFITRIENCKSEWVDDFGNMYLALNTKLGREDWWKELQIHKLELDILLYF